MRSSASTASPTRPWRTSTWNAYEALGERPMLCGQVRGELADGPCVDVDLLSVLAAELAHAGEVEDGDPHLPCFVLPLTRSTACATTGAMSSFAPSRTAFS